MADQTVGISEPGSPSKLLDVSELTVNAKVVERERMNIADPTTAAALAAVLAALPVAASAYGLVVRPIAQRPSVGTFSTVVAANSSTLVLAANAARLGGILFNDSAAVAYVGMSTTTVSTTAFSYQMQPNDTLEIPFGYTGDIKAIWTSATGNMRLTELT